MSKKPRVVQKWQGYYLEDCECSTCLHYLGRKKGCNLNECCCDKEKTDAITNGRINRKRGSMSWHG